MERPTLTTHGMSKEKADGYQRGYAAGWDAVFQQVVPGRFVTHVEDGSPAMVFAVFTNKLRLLNEDAEMFDVPRSDWVASDTIWWGENDYALEE
jgi:hypothetical protein